MFGGKNARKVSHWVFYERLIARTKWRSKKLVNDCRREISIYPANKQTYFMSVLQGCCLCQQKTNAFLMLVWACAWCTNIPRSSSTHACSSHRTRWTDGPMRPQQLHPALTPSHLKGKRQWMEINTPYICFCKQRSLCMPGISEIPVSTRPAHIKALITQRSNLESSSAPVSGSSRDCDLHQNWYHPPPYPTFSFLFF